MIAVNLIRLIRIALGPWINVPALLAFLPTFLSHTSESGKREVIVVERRGESGRTCLAST